MGELAKKFPPKVVQPAHPEVKGMAWNILLYLSGEKVYAILERHHFGDTGIVYGANHADGIFSNTEF